MKSVFRISRPDKCLRRGGLIGTRQRGRGTFVAAPKYEQDLLHLYSVHDYTKQTGHLPGSDIIEFSEEKAGVKVAEYLGVNPESMLYKIVRIRTIDTEPIMYDQIYLPRY